MADVEAVETVVPDARLQVHADVGAVAVRRGRLRLLRRAPRFEPLPHGHRPVQRYADAYAAGHLGRVGDVEAVAHDVLQEIANPAGRVLVVAGQVEDGADPVEILLRFRRVVRAGPCSRRGQDWQYEILMTFTIFSALATAGRRRPTTLTRSCAGRTGRRSSHRRRAASCSPKASTPDVDTHNDAPSHGHPAVTGGVSLSLPCLRATAAPIDQIGGRLDYVLGHWVHVSPSFEARVAKER